MQSPGDGEVSLQLFARYRFTAQCRLNRRPIGWRDRAEQFWLDIEDVVKAGAERRIRKRWSAETHLLELLALLIPALRRYAGEIESGKRRIFTGFSGVWCGSDRDFVKLESFYNHIVWNTQAERNSGACLVHDIVPRGTLGM